MAKNQQSEKREKIYNLQKDAQANPVISRLTNLFARYLPDKNLSFEKNRANSKANNIN